MISHHNAWYITTLDTLNQTCDLWFISCLSSHVHLAYHITCSPWISHSMFTLQVTTHHMRHLNNMWFMIHQVVYQHMYTLHITSYSWFKVVHPHLAYGITSHVHLAYHITCSPWISHHMFTLHITSYVHLACYNTSPDVLYITLHITLHITSHVHLACYVPTHDALYKTCDPWFIKLYTLTYSPCISHYL